MKFSIYFLTLFLFFATASHAVTSNIQISADFLEFDASKNNAIASGNVVVQQKDVTIHGRRGIYNQAKSTIELTQDIKVTRGDMVLVCKSIYANGLQNIVQAKGNVSFDYKDLKGSADTATYDLNKQTITLSGQPVAWQGQDQVKGDMIIIDLVKSKVQTKGKAQIFFSPERF